MKFRNRGCGRTIQAAMMPPSDAMCMIFAAWAEERGVSPEAAETIATRVLAPYLTMPISRPSTQKIINEFLHEVSQPQAR